MQNLKKEFSGQKTTTATKQQSKFFKLNFIKSWKKINLLYIY